MIRLATIDDIEQLRFIYNDAVLNTTATFDTDIKDYSNRLEWFNAHTGKYVLYVFEEQNNIYGYASLSQYRERKAFDKTVEISVYIHPDHQGKGVGKALTEKVLDFAKNNDEIQNVVSLITGNNTISVHLHEKFNFEYCGEIKCAGEKFGQSLDLKIFQLIV